MFDRYYTVSGPRKLRDDEGHFTGKVEPQHVRLATVFLESAQQFATAVYRDEGIMCEIHEHMRAADAT